MGFSGNKFTYSNRRKESAEVKVCLDRCFGNDKWCSISPACKVRHLVAHISDHNPIFLSLDSNIDQIRKPFRFEDMWFRDSSFLNFVSSKWSSWNDSPAPLLDKLSFMQGALEEWNKSLFAHVGKHLKTLNEKLENISNLPRTAAKIELEGAIRNQIFEWCVREEIMWLREWDKNTKFFHRRASARRKKNNISFLTTKSGDVIDNKASMESEVTSYFSRLF